MNKLDKIEALFRELDLSDVERIEDPNHEWMYLRLWNSRDKAVTLEYGADGGITVELVEMAELEDEPVVRGCVTTLVPAVAVEAFLGFMARAR